MIEDYMRAIRHLIAMRERTVSLEWIISIDIAIEALRKELDGIDREADDFRPCVARGAKPPEDTIPCIGYSISEYDDEPCEMCKECPILDGREDLLSCKNCKWYGNKCENSGPYEGKSGYVAGEDWCEFYLREEEEC